MRRKSQRRGSGRPFKKGDKRAGRPRGARNKVTTEAKAAMNEIVDNPEYRAALLQRMIAGDAGAMEPICWYFAKGKPKERVELGADKSLAQLVLEAAGVVKPTAEPNGDA